MKKQKKDNSGIIGLSLIFLFVAFIFLTDKEQNTIISDNINAFHEGKVLTCGKLEISNINYKFNGNIFYKLNKGLKVDITMPSQCYIK